MQINPISIEMNDDNFQSSFKQFLQDFLTKGVKFYQDNPNAMLMNWQQLEFADSEQQGWNFKDFAKILQYYQSIGEINPKLSVDFICIFIQSILGSIFLRKNIALADINKVKKYINFCVKTVIKGLV